MNFERIRMVRMVRSLANRTFQLSGKHAGLGADVAHVGAVEGAAELADRVDVQLAVLRQRRRVDLEDVGLCFF